jgi:hypothetical protein
VPGTGKALRKKLRLASQRDSAELAGKQAATSLLLTKDKCVVIPRKPRALSGGRMGISPGAAPCLLTPQPDEANRFTAVPGTLKLVVKQTKGQTDLDCLNSKVLDITDFTNQVPVSHTCDRSSFSFDMNGGKKYFVSLTFVQLVDPFKAKASLNEACGQELDIIDATNLFPGYIIEVA